MTAAQWDGLIRMGLAGLLWFVVLGAWVWVRRAKRKDEDETPESVNGFWQ